MQLPVLLVEDDEGVRWALRELLEEEGYTVEELAHGDEALQYLSTTSQPYLVFLDLHLPQLSGETLVEAIDHTPALRQHHFIVMSGSKQVSFSPTFQAHLQTHHIPFLDKPFELTQVLDLLADIESTTT